MTQLDESQLKALNDAGWGIDPSVLSSPGLTKSVPKTPGLDSGLDPAYLKSLNDAGWGIESPTVDQPASTTTKTSKIGDIINQAADKYAPGDEEFKKVLHAIALAESNGNPKAAGDGGHSIGLFQNNMVAGRGYGYTKDQLEDPNFNADLSAKDLYNYYKKGAAQGLAGANLVAYVSRNGQRPAPGNEWNAAKNYGRYVDVDPTVAMNEPQLQQQDPNTGLLIPDTPTPSPTITPTPMLNDLVKQNIIKRIQQVHNLQVNGGLPALGN